MKNIEMKLEGTIFQNLTNGQSCNYPPIKKSIDGEKEPARMHFFDIRFFPSERKIPTI